MFSISLSKGLISILQHHFQDNFSDQFSRHVLPSLWGVTHFWWQWIDYKETGGELSAFWRLTGIRWDLVSGFMKLYLPNFPSCPSLRNENDGHIWAFLHTCGFSVSLEPGEVLVVSHRKFTLCLVIIADYPGGCFGVCKEDSVQGRSSISVKGDSWSPYHLTRGVLTSHSSPVSSIERVKWGLCQSQALEYLPGVAINFLLWPNTASPWLCLVDATEGVSKEPSFGALFCTVVTKPCPQRRWTTNILTL